MTADEWYTIELNEWNRVIDFYFEELALFNERLAEVAGKNNKPAVTGAIEHFQNQFIVQKEVLQALKHDMHRQLAEITSQVKGAAKITNMNTVDTEFVLRDRVHTAEKILLELKHSFYRFLATVL